MANIGYEGQYHVRIINQDINTKDDDTSQNNTSEPLNVQTGQEGKVADTDVVAKIAALQQILKMRLIKQM